MHKPTPQTIQELQSRCEQLASHTLGQLAHELQIVVPENLLRAKGWMGQLIELYLGATSSSKAEPDFPHLSVELKTIPVTQNLQPLESTYVCTVQTNVATLSWRNSWVYQKLKTVLWVPVIAEDHIPLAERKICQPILWHMDPDTEETLRTDWEELMEMLQFGDGKKLTAKYGTFLHVRPKAANSKVLIDYIDADGQQTRIVPRGFYLRPVFTRQILLHNHANIYP